MSREDEQSVLEVSEWEMWNDVFVRCGWQVRVLAWIEIIAGSVGRKLNVR